MGIPLPLQDLACQGAREVADGHRRGGTGPLWLRDNDKSLSTLWCTSGGERWRGSHGSSDKHCRRWHELEAFGNRNGIA
jgi:hypothetical protein